jgi:hypothetical protein
MFREGSLAKHQMKKKFQINNGWKKVAATKKKVKGGIISNEVKNYKAKLGQGMSNSKWKEQL